MSTTVLDRDIRTTPTPVRRRLSRKTLLLGAGALLIAAGGAWYGHDWWIHGRFIESTDDAYVGGDVTVIATKVPGFIAKIAVGDNQAVKAGDLLVQIDDRDYRAALAKATAAVAAQQATLENLDAQRRLQNALIAQARAGVAASDAEMSRARSDQSRYRTLSATAAASVQTYERAEADYKQAIAGGQRADATLDAAQRQLDVIETRKQEVAAALAGAIADRDRAQLDLENTALRAPIDGTVGNRSARAGAYAIAGTQLLSVVPARGLWVDANFKENQLAKMRPGLAATVVADVLPNQVLRGHVVSLAPATGAQFSVLPPENATGNFTKIVQRVPVRIRLDDDAGTLGRLRPGLSVTAEVDSRAP